MGGQRYTCWEWWVRLHRLQPIPSAFRMEMAGRGPTDDGPGSSRDGVWCHFYSHSRSVSLHPAAEAAAAAASTRNEWVTTLSPSVRVVGDTTWRTTLHSNWVGGGGRGPRPFHNASRGGRVGLGAVGSRSITTRTTTTTNTNTTTTTSHQYHQRRGTFFLPHEFTPTSTVMCQVRHKDPSHHDDDNNVIGTTPPPTRTSTMTDSTSQGLVSALTGIINAWSSIIAVDNTPTTNRPQQRRFIGSKRIMNGTIIYGRVNWMWIVMVRSVDLPTQPCPLRGWIPISPILKI
jgi:hypothetical protein